jgi:hypothetical protein
MLTGLKAPSETLSLGAEMAAAGFAFVRAPCMRQLLAATGSLDDWPAFEASWAALEMDRYMADGGRYRRRRYAVYSVARGGHLAREAHQPHFQTRTYNALNGGIERWFAPIEDAVGGGRSMATILGFCERRFAEMSPATRAWHAEVHQFRIEAEAGIEGRPTPEGLHRDGVDYVLVLMLGRTNVINGTTTIADDARRPIASLTLAAPFDAMLIDDQRVYHGVAPIAPLDPAKPAHRDVLVVTFRGTD